jgi:AraC family ethanolamine operon transcriptional activator
MPAETSLRLRTLTTQDADDLARNLTGWDQVYDQISCGAFAGGLDELRLPDMQVFRERINQAVHQVCCVRPDAFWFGLPLETDASRINGRVVETASVMARPGNRQFELLTPQGHDIYGVVVSRSLIEEGERRNGVVAALDRIESADILRVDPAARAACVRELSAVMAGKGVLDGLDAQDRVVDALLLMLDAASVEAAAHKSQQRRQHIVAKARKYAFANRMRAVSIPELCEHTHVSRRTLQYCFESVLGISPVVYLRRLRLNDIRRALLDNAEQAGCIGAVAADWGIDNFSQFSSDYKKLFGRSPSAYVKMSRSDQMGRQAMLPA